MKTFSRVIFSRVNQLIIVAGLATVTVGCVLANSRFQSAKTGEQSVPQDTRISLDRTACYGMCPIYKVTISADGAVTFEGNRFVKKVGTSTSMVSIEQIRRLLEAFEKINYFDLSDQYVKPEDGCKQWVTDNPSAITSITVHGKSKTVTHYYGCRGPEVLTELAKLEQAIDDAVNSAQWIR